MLTPDEKRAVERIRKALDDGLPIRLTDQEVALRIIDRPSTDRAPSAPGSAAGSGDPGLSVLLAEADACADPATPPDRLANNGAVIQRLARALRSRAPASGDVLREAAQRVLDEHDHSANCIGGRHRCTCWKAALRSALTTPIATPGSDPAGCAAPVSTEESDDGR